MLQQGITACGIETGHHFYCDLMTRLSCNRALPLAVLKHHARQGRTESRLMDSCNRALPLAVLKQTTSMHIMAPSLADESCNWVIPLAVLKPFQQLC